MSRVSHRHRTDTLRRRAGVEAVIDHRVAHDASSAARTVRPCRADRPRGRPEVDTRARLSAGASRPYLYLRPEDPGRLRRRLDPQADQIDNSDWRPTVPISSYISAQLAGEHRRQLLQEAGEYRLARNATRQRRARRPSLHLVAAAQRRLGSNRRPSLGSYANASLAGADR